MQFEHNAIKYDAIGVGVETLCGAPFKWRVGGSDFPEEIPPSGGRALRGLADQNDFTWEFRLRPLFMHLPTIYPPNLEMLRWGMEVGAWRGFSSPSSVTITG